MFQFLTVFVDVALFKKIILGAFGLPLGLFMTVVTGGELFTGNTALVTAAYMDGEIKALDLVKNWTASYLGNIVGALVLACLAHRSQTLCGNPAAIAIATAKCMLPWGVAFIRGILCIWLVATAIYMASGCNTLEGKMTSIWFLVSGFVAIGLDQSIANMFIIPFGMLCGADITVQQMLTKNIIPVTLGNAVGGAICVMAPFGLTFGRWGKRLYRPRR